MISFGVKSNLDGISKGLNDMAKKQIPFATSVALNRTAVLARVALRGEMEKKFDRPTLFTLNSLFVKSSTKSSLTATIGHKERSGSLPASKYLRWEIFGGNRSQKSTEKGAGGILVPTRFARLDRFGNMPSRILAAVRAASAAPGGRAVVGNVEYVVVKQGNPRGLTPGVYVREKRTVKIRRGPKGRSRTGAATGVEQYGGAFKPIMFFQAKAQYSRRYDMLGVVDQVVKRDFGALFAKAMDQALASASIRIRA